MEWYEVGWGSRIYLIFERINLKFDFWNGKLGDGWMQCPQMGLVHKVENETWKKKLKNWKQKEKGILVVMKLGR